MLFWFSLYDIDIICFIKCGHLVRAELRVTPCFTIQCFDGCHSQISGGHPPFLSKIREVFSRRLSTTHSDIQLVYIDYVAVQLTVTELRDVACEAAATSWTINIDSAHSTSLGHYGFLLLPSQSCYYINSQHMQCHLRLLYHDVAAAVSSSNTAQVAATSVVVDCHWCLDFVKVKLTALLHYFLLNNWRKESPLYQS